MLTAAKSTLEKTLASAEDLLHVAEQTDDPSEELTEKTCTLKAVVEQVRGDLGKIRTAIMKHKAVKASNDDLQDRIDEITGLNGVAMTHKDGFVSLKKKVTAVM